ncbi:MAG: hypothetical protein K0R16_1466 [Nitrososphaeraceae archaeon]|jgi:hypothetical protein|nr:hypothetical protein [Nitrososphaeraceae archaeon]
MSKIAKLVVVCGIPEEITYLGYIIMSKIAKLVVVCGIPEEITYLGYIIMLLQNNVNIHTRRLNKLQQFIA